jgi:Sec-independent protein translocase protein TatA
MGDPDQQQRDVGEAVRRAREQMHSVTESLRALLEDLRDDGARPADEPQSRSNPRKRSQSVTAAS